MQRTNLFVQFEQGKLLLPKAKQQFGEIGWVAHSVFDGVSLKHLVTAEASGGKFSFHLVRIMPGMSICAHVHKGQLESHEVIAGQGYCINDAVQMEYHEGVISIFQADVLHEVHAGENGLYIFAKFFPALC